jgi:two-component system, NarL family, nitrate/nitrite response regulator NarL
MRMRPGTRDRFVGSRATTIRRATYTSRLPGLTLSRAPWDGRRVAARGATSAAPRVLVCARIRLHRESLVGALRREGMAATAAAPGADCLQRAQRADVVVLEADGATGAGFVRELAAAAPAVRIVAFGVVEDDRPILAYAGAGVAAFVAPEQALDELLAAVWAVQRGETRCSARVSAILLRGLAARPPPAAMAPSGSHLTPREREVLELIDQGLSNKQIGRALGIELPTVKNHVHNILEKLDASGRGEAAARMRRGLGVHG